MKEIRVTRSFIAADSLAGVINDEYDLGSAAECKLFSKLLRTQDNDHYLVQAGNDKFVARVYQLGKHLEREESDYQYELDWLQFLHEQGQPVAYPIVRRDGTFLGQLNAPEGPRYYALFSFAPGRPMRVADREELFSLGSHMARIHLVSNNFQTPYSRQPIDLEYLIDRPVERLNTFWEHSRAEDLDLLQSAAAEAKAEIQAILDNEEFTTDSWGPIGGDFHSANTFFTEDGQPHFFNFDLCGPGWRAYDIASFVQNANLFQLGEDASDAFFAGYYSVRPLSENEHNAVSAFLTIRRVWLTSIFSREDGMVGHTFIAPVQVSFSNG